MDSTGKLCKAVTRSGAPCQTYALEGSEFCFWHDPGRAAERKAARAKGGKARHGRTLGPVKPEEYIELATMADVLNLVEKAVNDTLKLENSLQRARNLGYLAGIALNALQADEIEQRLAALEHALKLRDDR